MPRDTILKTVPLEIMYANFASFEKGPVAFATFDVWYCILCRSMLSYTNFSLATGRTARA